MNGTEGPLVTVIAVCYNHSTFVEGALLAIANQTYDNIELIIMDDCSTDDSVEKIVSWLAERPKLAARFVAHESNIGLCATLNEALDYSSGKYIQIIACDDQMLPQKTALQVATLERAQNRTVAVCSNFISTDKEGNQLSIEFDDRFVFPSQGDVFTYILNGYQGYSRIVHSPTVMVRRDVLFEMNKYDPKIIQEDLDMWLKISLKYKFAYISIPLVKYRVLESSLSNSSALKPRLLADRVLVGAKFLRLNLSDKRRSEVLKHNKQVLYNIVNADNSRSKLEKLIVKAAVDNLEETDYKHVNRETDVKALTHVSVGRNLKPGKLYRIGIEVLIKISAKLKTCLLPQSW